MNKNRFKQTCRNLTLIASIAVAGITSANALERGNFKAFHIKAIEGMDLRTIAIADASKDAQEWLSQNYAYLLDKRIPIILVGSSNDELNSMRAMFEGLQIGLAPEPVKYLDQFLLQIGVKQYPVVIENGIAWQSKQ